MVSNESEQVTEFRQEVRAWLTDNLPKGWGTPEYVAPETSKERHELGKWWVKKLYNAGYTAFDYPTEYGGIERPEWQRLILSEETKRTGTPNGPMSNIMVVAPTLLTSGQEWQKKRFLPKMLSGEEAWVQGFSEPNAGSDLANVQTTAVRDGDDWVVNGQKVWNSLWEFADFGILVVKTDPEGRRHRNLSYFIFDCKSPGYTARPLRQMTGGSEFCEMFFDNVRIPHENLLGELNMGWYSAMATLVAERDSPIYDDVMGVRVGLANTGVPASSGVSSLGSMDRIVELAQNTQRYGKAVWDDSTFRQRIAQLAIESEAVKHSGARAVVRLRKGIPMGDEVNIGKHFKAEMQQRRTDLVMEIIGAYSQLWQGSKHAVDGGAYVHAMLASRAETIAAGTSEINRNVIAERILGMPRLY
jgi:alkylation response protein AidB-like acyl-CoA dehydrogenase